MFFFFPSAVAPDIWPVFGHISVPGIYIETYIYDDVYVLILMPS